MNYDEKKENPQKNNLTNPNHAVSYVGSQKRYLSHAHT